MEANGIMEGIRSLLSQGLSSREIIALGFRPGTVYKTQRQWARRGNLAVKEQPTGVESASDDPVGHSLDEADGRVTAAWNPFLEKHDPGCLEVEPIDAQLERAEARIEEIGAQVANAQSLLVQMAGLEQQVESLTHNLAAQERQIGLWKERLGQLIPVITAMCTQLHCTDEVMVASQLPEHLKQRSDEAMGIVRKHSQYKGEEAEQDAAIIASLMSASG